MTRLNSKTLLAAGLVLGTAASCTDGSTPLGSVYIQQGLISATNGGSLAVTQQLCADDAKVCPFVGTSIVVPRGALTADTKITISVGQDAKDRAGKTNGPALDFGPDGTTFSSPVEVTIPVARDIDKNLLRIYVTQADGTKSVLMPYQIAYDRAAGTARFLVSHFTTFQCGEGDDPCSDVPGCNAGCENGACNDPCDISECGPQPGAPSWTCDDGTVGGFSCERLADGSCGWQLNDCPEPCPLVCDSNGQCEENCDPNTCGGVVCPPGSSCDPATNTCVNACVCDDGQPCTIGADGTVFCGNNGCDPNTPCPDGSACDPATGTCNPGCVCPDGSSCESSPNGNPTCAVGCGNNGIACPPGSTCDPNTNTCVNECVCDDGTPCEVGPDGTVSCNNASCDANTACPPGSTCDPATGNCINGCVCPDGQACTIDANGTVSCGSNECDPSQCGPQPGVPSWTCDDGTPGGSTGRCILIANDGTCGWEIIWCEQGCDPSVCNGQPPPSDPNEVCPDGTIPPYVCDHDENGVCAWVTSCGSNPGGN